MASWKTSETVTDKLYVRLIVSEHIHKGQVLSQLWVGHGICYTSCAMPEIRLSYKYPKVVVYRNIYAIRIRAV